MTRWLLYGANGFTGRLIAEEARRRGERPILAGRSRTSIEALGAALEFETRVFDLENAETHLRDVDVVLHCAGPFSKTHAAMLNACLATGTHYLDITGEIPVFEALHARFEDLRRAGIVAVPGVGFDVVPTDGVAALLARRLPTASRLKLAITGTTVSPGTATTAVEMVTLGGLSRQGGLLVSEPIAARTWTVRRGDRSLTAASFPWGDVSTAYRSTGIATVETYVVVPRRAIGLLRALNVARPLLSMPFVQRTLVRRARRATGPSEQERREERSVVWGEATDPLGRTERLMLEGPEAYAFTVEAALAAVERTRRGDVPPGAWTPSLAFGADFASTLPGVRLQEEPA